MFSGLLICFELDVGICACHVTQVFCVVRVCLFVFYHVDFCCVHDFAHNNLIVVVDLFVVSTFALEPVFEQ